jgi:hypothetical protein
MILIVRAVQPAAIGAGNRPENPGFIPEMRFLKPVGIFRRRFGGFMRRYKAH